MTISVMGERSGGEAEQRGSDGKSGSRQKSELRSSRYCVVKSRGSPPFADCDMVRVTLLMASLDVHRRRYVY